MRDSRDHSALKGFSITYLALLGALVLSVVLMGVTFCPAGAAGRAQRNSVEAGRRTAPAVTLDRNEALGPLAARRPRSPSSRESRDRFEQILNDQKSGSEH